MPRVMRISIILGVLFLVFLTGRLFWIRSTAPPPKPKVQYTKVVIASVDIPAHTVITGAMLREERRHPKDVPRGAFSRVDDVINRVAKMDIFAGTPVLQTDVTQPISQEGLGTLIPEGYVAVALPIDNEALYRMLRTGDHVRIIASFGGLLSQTIVEDSVVLGVDTKVMNVEVSVRGQPPEAQQQQAQQQAQQPSPLRTLLLLVRPEEAEKIALVSAQSNVKLEFSLLPSRPPIPAQLPGQPRKPPTMARDIHPAVERIAAKGAGIPLDEIDRVVGREGVKPAVIQPPQLPPAEPARIAAEVHGKLLSELAPQVQGIREEQEHIRKELRSIQRLLAATITDAELKQLMAVVDGRIEGIEKKIEGLKAEAAPPEIPVKETMTIFLGDRSIRAEIGQPVTP